MSHDAIRNVFRHGIFNVKVLKEGDSYGLTGCLTWLHEEPGIEFYAALTQSGAPIAENDGLGFFASRYYYTTMLGCAHKRKGICLDGGHPRWLSVNAEDVEIIMASVTRYVMEFATAGDVLKWREANSFTTLG